MCKEKQRFQKADRVKVVKIIDDEIKTHQDNNYIDQIGTVVKEGSGETVETMISVEFDNGDRDSFWPEELQKLESKKVVINISGGLVQSVEKPDNIDVEVRDYDLDGFTEEELIKTDSEGDKYVPQKW